MPVALDKRWLALYMLCAGELMIVLDTTIVNVALPSIHADLGFSETALVWVVNAYMLTYGGFLLLGGRLGDLYGRRRLFLAVLASLAAARTDGVQTPEALTAGYHPAFAVAAVFAVIAATMSAWLPRVPTETPKEAQWATP